MQAQTAPRDSFLERFFHLAENQTTVRREILGGLTTFVTMAYIIVVNPNMLHETGMPIEGVLVATAVSAAAATLVMGLYANYPIALAPGMGLNAYFTYSVVMGMKIPWTTALGVVFISGVLFLVLTLTRIREQIVNGIPDCIKLSTPAGIGLFIAFVGLKNSHLIVANPSTFVSLGVFSDPDVQVAAFGLLLTGVLISRGVNGGILLGIAGATVFAGFRGLTHWPAGLFSIPDVSGTLLKLDLKSAVQLGLFEITFVFLFVDLFDNVGTLVGVCEQAGFVRNGKIPRANKALVSDALGSIMGSLTGTSTVTSYIESAAGVAAGARTGLSNVVVAGFFLAAVFFAPLIAIIPAAATAPALIIVGALMVRSVASIAWADFTESLPAFITLLATPLTFSVATGLSLGLVVFTVMKVGTGRWKEISVLLWILTVLFVFRYIYLAAG
jgi:AGZA family xanthine/uracil permease-like MFS transporter